MTLELGGSVRRGEIHFGERGVEGSLWIAGRALPLRLNLSGWIRGGLSNCRLTFTASGDPDLPSGKIDLERLATEQVGPVGHCLVQSVQAPGRIATRSTHDSLCMEWYGQNGHVLLRAAELRFELLDDSSLCHKDGNLVPPFDWDELARIDGNQPLLRPLVEERLPKVIEEIIAMDRSLESPGQGKAVRDLFEPPLAPPSPKTPSGPELEKELRIVLAQLARVAIRVDPCEHSNPQSTYQYIFQHVLDAETCISFLPVHTVTHYSLWEDCKQCQEEFEEEAGFDEYQGQA